MLAVRGGRCGMGVILAFVIARSFSVPLGQAVGALERVAEGDLTVSLDVNTKDEVGRMATALNNALEKLRSTLEEVSQGAMNASAASQQLAAASQAIASGAQEQAASLEETSASLEEITATVRQSADNARPGEPAGFRIARRGRAGPGSGLERGHGHGRDQRRIGKDRRHHRHHRRDRFPDQPAGGERGRGSGAGRRGGTRIRRGRRRGSHRSRSAAPKPRRRSRHSSRTRCARWSAAPIW